LFSAAVLDRLNTCLESNGELLLSERGDCEEPIKAHPNFRVFFTMDEANGTISRAMRNRSIELFVLPEQNAWNRRILDVIVSNSDNFSVIDKF
uniref:SAM-dependent methyltransferase n=1 Tax=Anisakis simplex TaxID=6269 RepID=A0A0M3JQ76_ANISI